MPTETYSEPTGYAATAADLRRIVEALESLPPTTDRPYLSVTLVLGKDAANAVDALGDALFGLPGVVQRSGEAWYHVARTYEPRLSLTVQSEVPGPPDERDAELERLRAELAEARAAADPDHGRTTAVAEAKPDTLGIPFTGRAAVPSRESRGALAGTTPVTTYFSFGHGQTDPDTGENLLDKYVTVIAPTYEACREAMFASRYGQAWSFDYPAGTPTADKWIPQWTEHERIVVDSAAVPDMQTRPRCSPDCGWLLDYAPDHSDDCPAGGA